MKNLQNSPSILEDGTQISDSCNIWGIKYFAWHRGFWFILCFKHFVLMVECWMVLVPLECLCLHRKTQKRWMFFHTPSRIKTHNLMRSVPYNYCCWSFIMYWIIFLSIFLIMYIRDVIYLISHPSTWWLHNFSKQRISCLLHPCYRSISL